VLRWLTLPAGRLQVAVSVSVQAGQAPERVRATLTCALRSADGRGVSFGTRYMAVRAEVQEPKVRSANVYQVLLTPAYTEVHERVHQLAMKTHRASSCSH
jgi:hypothetical protein